MAKIVGFAIALQALAEVTGRGRRLQSGAEDALEFPIEGVKAAAGILGQWTQQAGPLTGNIIDSWPSLPEVELPFKFPVPEVQPDSLFDVHYNLIDIRQIAEGRSAKIYKAQLRHNPEQHIVVKEVIPRTEQEVEALKKEIRYLRRFADAPEIITLYRAASARDLVPGENVLLVMERAIGNLNKVVASSFDEVPEGVRVKLFVDIVRAVRLLERARAAHHNLTPDNILIVGQEDDPDTWNAVLCDTADMCTYPVDTGFNFVWPTGDTTRTIDADIKALDGILKSLIAQESPHEGVGSVLEPHDRSAVSGGSTETLKEMLGVWDAMYHPAKPLQMRRVLKRLEEIAAKHQIDVTPRQTPKLQGWSFARSFLTKVTGFMM